jgi:hypothetical protein
MGSSECVHYAAPHTSPPPANEAVAASGIRAARFRQITPGRSGSQDPEDAVENATVVHPRNATGLIGQHRLDGGPFMVGELMVHDSKLPVWESESQGSGQTPRSPPAPGGAAFWAKRTSNGRQNPRGRSNMTHYRRRPSCSNWAWMPGSGHPPRSQVLCYRVVLRSAWSWPVGEGWMRAREHRLRDFRPIRGLRDLGGRF